MHLEFQSQGARSQVVLMQTSTPPLTAYRFKISCATISGASQGIIVKRCGFECCQLHGQLPNDSFSSAAWQNSLCPAAGRREVSAAIKMRKETFDFQIPSRYNYCSVNPADMIRRTEPGDVPAPLLRCSTSSCPAATSSNLYNEMLEFADIHHVKKSRESF